VLAVITESNSADRRWQHDAGQQQDPLSCRHDSTVNLAEFINNLSDRKSKKRTGEKASQTTNAAESTRDRSVLYCSLDRYAFRTDNMKMKLTAIGS
jgi:hypothetical protein